MIIVSVLAPPALSLAAQLACICAAITLGRLRAKSRNAAWGWALLGGLGAMLANILVDGQGAFLFLFVVPVIYVFVVIGRRELD